MAQVKNTTDTQHQLIQMVINIAVVALVAMLLVIPGLAAYLGFVYLEGDLVAIVAALLGYVYVYSLFKAFK